MARQIPPAAGGILSYFVRHKTAANLLLVVLLVAGLVATPKMRAQFFPDTVTATVTVSVLWAGAGAEDVDRAIIQPLEPALLAVDGVTGSSSTASDGRARIRLTFEPGHDIDRAAEDVQAAVDLVNTLPSEAETPEVQRGQWRDRVTDVVITGPVGTDQLARFTDEFVLRLFAEGVTRTTVQGIAAPLTTIEVASVDLMTHDITLAEIAAAIAAEVSTDPAGDLAGANTRVRTGSERRTARDIAAISLRSNPDGSTLTVGDLALVRVEEITRDRSYFVGDNPAMTLRVDRSQAGDAIGIQAQVESVAAAFQATLPDGVTIDLIRTRAEAISGRLQILLSNGLTGLGLVVILLFLFLNARTAFWVAAGIPVALLAAIAMMYLAGLTFNMISLFALIITLGIVVDDAIVVGEHADARARKLNEPPSVAAENAARRMALPVFSATLTTIIAFFGLAFIGGGMGNMIADIPYTVVLVLAASLIECFLILPHHMSKALSHTAQEHWYDAPSRLVNRGFRQLRDRLFRPAMAHVITWRYPVIAATVLILSSQVALLVSGKVQWRFFAPPEQGSITGNFVMLPGATRADTLAMMRELQRATEALGAEYAERYGADPLAYVLAEIGGNSGAPLAGADTREADLLGGIAIELIDADLRPYSSFQFVADLQDSVRRHPLTETISFRGWRMGPGGSALDVQFFGADAEGLKAASEALQEALTRFPEVSAIEDSMAYDKEELLLDLTPQGQALGFTIDALGRSLRHALNGIEAATYPDGPRSAAIRVELPRSELTADFLDRMQMRAPSGVYVPLAEIVSVASRTGFSTVRRENGLRVISVTADISEDDAEAASEVMRALEAEILPAIAASHQVEYRLAGLAEQERDFMGDALSALILSLTGIYLVLAWVFASWSRPVVVMAIIPFGLVGTIWGHYIWDVPMSMFTIVGLLGMVGIIINDSIVLVTTIDEHARDRGLVPAIIEGASDRLRPVMLTTLTTVLGLVPLLYESSTQAQFLKPTVITLVYGLAFGMLLVLIVVPALIAIQHDIGRQVTALRRSLVAPALRAVMRPLALGGLVWMGATLGHVALTGALWPPLAVLAPGLAASAPMTAALALMLLPLAAVLAVVYAALALRHGLHQGRKPAPRPPLAGE